MRKLIVILATGFYSGYFPVASGTAGTLVGILIFIPFSFLNSVQYFIALLLLTFCSFWIAAKADEIFQESDSGKIVIDEIVGFLFTMLWIPLSPESLWPKIILGFFLFRFTDIIKFFPARWIDQKVKSGVGVVLDDVVAGIYANLMLRGLLILWTKYL